MLGQQVSFHQRTRNLGLVRMRQPRSYFFRCSGCGTELIHTVDLALLAEPWWKRALRRLPSWGGFHPAGPKPELAGPVACHCGGTWEPAGVPRLVNPDEGGDGMIFEVQPMAGWSVEVDPD